MLAKRTTALCGFLLSMVLAVLPGAGQAQPFASVLEGAGRPDSVVLSVPTDPCGALWAQVVARGGRAEISYRGVTLETETFFRYFCEDAEARLREAVTAPYNEAVASVQAAIDGAVNDAKAELQAGFWAFVAEELYARLPPEAQAQYPPGSPESYALAHEWLNNAPGEVQAYVIAYLTRGGKETSYLVQAWQAYSDVTSGESAQILSQLGGLLDEAQTRLQQITRAREALEAAPPDTPTADVLESVGLSGEWVDRFKENEGLIRGIDANWKITEAVGIVRTAMGSDQPVDKIQGFFNLIEFSGGLAAESRLPLVSLVGAMVRDLGVAANEMLTQTLALGEAIAARNGYCLGVGAPGNDPKSRYFVARNVLACPISLETSPWRHIYLSQGAGSTEIFFWTGSTFIAAQNRGRDAILEAMRLIAAARDLGYNLEPDPPSHAALLGRVYATNHPGGIPGLVDVARRDSDTIRTTLEAVRAIHVAGDICGVGALFDEVDRRFQLDSSQIFAEFARDPRRIENAIAVSRLAAEGALGAGGGRGLGAARTYRDIAERIAGLTLVIFDGQVVEEDGRGVPGAVLDVTVAGGSEVRGCEAWQADADGRFQIAAMAEGPGLSVAVGAEVDGRRGEEPPWSLDVVRAQAFTLRPREAGGLTARAALRVILPPVADEEEQAPPPECDALAAALAGAEAGLRAGVEAGWEGDRVLVLEAESAALAAGGCDGHPAGPTAPVLARLDAAIAVAAQVDSVLSSCGPEAMSAMSARIVVGIPGVSLGQSARRLARGQDLARGFEAARSAYLNNRLDLAEAGLLAVIDGMRAEPEICAPLIMRAEQGLDNIARLREAEARIEAAIGRCDVAALDRMAAQIRDRDDHPFFAAARTRIAEARARCQADQADEADQAAQVCREVAASLDAADAAYQANRLDDARTGLDAARARLAGTQPANACPDQAARGRRLAADLDWLANAEARLAAAIDSCDRAALQRYREVVSGRSHPWFTAAQSRIATAIAACDAAVAVSCEPVASALAAARATLANGNFAAAADAARAAAGAAPAAECPAEVSMAEAVAGEAEAGARRIGRAVAALGDCDATRAAVAGGLLADLASPPVQHPTFAAAAARVAAARDDCDEDDDDEAAEEQGRDGDGEDGGNGPGGGEIVADLEGSWDGNGVFVISVLGETESIPYWIRFRVADGRVTGELGAADDPGTYAFSGRAVNGEIDVTGRISDDGITVPFVIDGWIGAPGRIDGTLAIDFPELECFLEIFAEAIGEAIGGAIADSVVPGLAPESGDVQERDPFAVCPIRRYSSDWSAVAAG